MANVVQHKSVDSNAANVSGLTAVFDSTPTEDGEMYAVISSLFSVGTITPPSGWALHGSQVSGASYEYTYKKTAGASEGTSVAFTWTGSRRSALTIFEIGAHDTASPIDEEANAASSGHVTSQTSGTTAATANANGFGVAIFTGATFSDFQTGHAYTNGYSELLANTEPGAAPWIRIATLDGIAASTAAETTLSTTDTGDEVCARIIVFNNGPLSAGTASVTDRTAMTASLSATDAAGGSGSYTYQWHRDTTSGFTPGPGNAVSGATSLTLTDTGLTENTAYYYVLEYDDGTDTVNSNEVSVTPSGAPNVVIVDHDGNTSGNVEIMGPWKASFECRSQSFIGSGEWCDAKVEWDFGDPSGDYNEHRGFSGGHIYDVEPVSNTDYTVTCTITNSSGASSSATRTVRVTPNTRRAVYVNNSTGSASPTDPTDSGDPYDTIANCLTGETQTDLEIRMEAGQTHVWGTAPGTGSDNVLIRSTVNGTKFNVNASVGAIINGAEIGMRDCDVTASSVGGAVRLLDPRLGTKKNSWLLDCDGNHVDVCQFVGDATTSHCVLQDVTTNGCTATNDIWYYGDNLVFLGSSSVAYNGSERPARGGGENPTFVQPALEYAYSSTGKTALTYVSGSGLYVDGEGTGSLTATSAATDTGLVLLSIGHTSGTHEEGPMLAIVERLQISLDASLTTGAKAVLLGGTNQECENVRVRNCVIEGAVWIGGQAVAYPSQNCYVVHCTMIERQTTAAHSQVRDEYANSGFKNCLYLEYTSKGEVINITDDSATPLLENNVTPPANSDDDVRVNGSATRDDWATYNARSSPDIGTGNLSKSISYDSGTYRPDDTDDSDILFSAPTEMGAVPEDYYGNARTGTYVAGAVDAVPAASSSVTPKMNISNDAASLAAYIQQYGIPAPQLDITPHHPGVVIDTSGISQPGIMPNG